MDWTEVYRPQTLSAVRGNDSARDALRSWAQAWPGEGRAVILHGRPGVGKTSAAHALAQDMDWHPVELNASDQRTASVIEEVAGEAAKSATLTGGRKLIILDEADNLHGTADRGGSGAITRLIKEAEQPIVLIANEFYDMSRGLRNACEDIEFRAVSTRSIIPVLRDICRKEGIEFDEEALRTIAEQTNGDLRSAINDLQAIAETTDALTVEDVVTSERDRTEGIFPFLDTVLKEASAQEALYAAYDVDETPDDLLAWVEDNVSKDYSGPELTRAYGRLAAGDRWLGRVRATQNYSYWRYVTDNVAAGVAASRDGTKGGWTRYGPPGYWRKLGSSRSARDRRDHVARKIGETAGVSMQTARNDVIPFLATMTHHCQDRELTVAMTERYDLEAEHVAFVTGSGQDTNKVQGIVREARERLQARTREAAPSGERPKVPEEVEEETSEADDESESDGQSGLADFV